MVTYDDDNLYMPWSLGNLLQHSLALPDAVVAHVGYQFIDVDNVRHPHLNYFPWPVRRTRVSVLVLGEWIYMH